ncbi:MAG: hypothetical protein Q9M22_05715 [Mariprofundaceae bacterium]|nr:hypothetical protein [Mariprofundaceae bacterium]
MNIYFLSLLVCLLSMSTISYANEEAANEAILGAIADLGAAAVEESSSLSSDKNQTGSAADFGVSNHNNNLVLINRSDLKAWMSQQKIQANVITNQANNQLWTTVLLTVVWLVTFVMLLHFMRQQRSTDYINVIGLNLIIFATVFMVLVVETDQQLTAGAGILGAIAGYLFRAMQNEQESPTPQKTEQHSEPQAKDNRS